MALDTFHNCKICWDKLKDPLFLPCAHGFCRQCVIRLIETRTRKCPLCRTRITWTVANIRCDGQYVDPHGDPYGDPPNAGSGINQ